MTDINRIKPEYRKIIHEVILTEEDCGVWLKRPWIFSASNASCTFLSFDDYENNINKTFAALNKCIADEAEKIDPDVWDKG